MHKITSKLIIRHIISHENAAIEITVSLKTSVLQEAFYLETT